MRGSVVFLAVLAVTSCSVGVNGAHFVKSGTTGRGNEDAPGIGEGAFGNWENDGRSHRIGKRSLLGLVRNLGHDVARLAAFRSAAARRQQMINPNPPFAGPILLPPIVEVTPPGMTGPILTPRPSTKPWRYPSLVKSFGLPLKRAVPSALKSAVQPLPALKFLQQSRMNDKAMKFLRFLPPGPHTLPATLPNPLARSSFARSQDFYRSDLKNRRSRYSGLRSYSPLRSYPTPPGRRSDDFIAMPLYKHARNTAPAQLETEEHLRREVRSAVIKYLAQLWGKIMKLFKPGSNSGGGVGGHLPNGGVPTGHIAIGGGVGLVPSLPPNGGVPPAGEIPIEGGEVLAPGLTEESEVHPQPPPEEHDDDVIIDHVPPPGDGDDSQTIHLSSGENASGTGGGSIGEGGSEIDDDYYDSIKFKPGYLQQQTNWEARHSSRMDDGFVFDDDDNYIPSWYIPVALDKSRYYTNWEARRAAGMEDGSEDSSSWPPGENMREGMDTLTNIFGRQADD